MEADWARPCLPGVLASDASLSLQLLTIRLETDSNEFGRFGNLADSNSNSVGAEFKLKSQFVFCVFGVQSCTM